MPGSSVPYQVLIGLNVLDDTSFEEFHSAIKPMLCRYDGEFGYDFDVPSALLTSQYRKINHIYTLSFASKKKMKGFFADKDYLMIRGRHILKSFRPEQIIFGYEQQQVNKKYHIEQDLHNNTIKSPPDNLP